MLIGKSPRSMLVVGFTAGLSLAAVSALLVMRAHRPADTLSDLMRKDGFDFTELRAPSKPWRGPELGEKIDLSRLKMADGRALAEVVAGGPAMLVAVDPSCRMCRTAADTMQEIGARLSVLGVPYHVVAFVPVGENFHAYAESLGAGRLSFVWSQDGEATPAPLIDAVQPSHILISRDGTVLRVWPGSHNAKPVRDRMGAQIVADTNVIVETLRALSRQADSNPAQRADSGPIRLSD